jgi:hypothetical protein
MKAASVIFDLWLNLHWTNVPNGKRPFKLRYETRPFLITDRIGHLRLYDDYLDVKSFKYTPGEVFAAFLAGNQESALLSAQALQYNVRTEFWHKRLTRYYSHYWGSAARDKSYTTPLTISTVFQDGLRIPIDSRWLAQMRERFVECHRTLQRDKVIANWRYELQDGPWSEWTIVIEPPNEILRSYDQRPREAARLELPPPSTRPVRIEVDAERIRTRREDLRISQRELAKQLGLSQTAISRAESGCIGIPQALRKWLEVS